MKVFSALSIGLVLFAAGCSKNDNPSGPGDSGAVGITRIFVNPASGSDGNTGTDTAPLKTIRKALALAQAGQRVDLQAGTYDAASGQTYPDTIPDGVVIEAVSAGLAVLVGTNNVAFTGSGNDTTLYLSVRGFRTIVQAASGFHVVNAMTVADVGTLFDLSGNAQALASGCSLTKSGVAQLTDIAHLTVNSSTVSGQPQSDFVTLQKASSLVMNGTTMSDANTTAIDITDVSTVTLTACTISKVSLQGAGGSASINMSGSSHLTIRSTTVSGAYGPVVLMRDPGTAVIARSSNFEGNDTGSGYPEFWQAGGSLDVDTCYISGSGSGANSFGFALQGGSLTLRNSIVRYMYGEGISVSSGTSLYMRNTTISNCRSGIYLNATSGSVDLGTSTDAGGNTINNCSQFGIRVGFAAGQVAYAYGNTWTPNAQGANANGHYGPFLAVGPVNPASPANYYIDSNANIQF
ncbi:MAG: right-handed parallel beta-helix repeat-containing protein [Bacteroidota bacterium]